MNESLENDLHKNSTSIIKELQQGKDVVLKATRKGLKIQSLRITNIQSEGEKDGC
jgi:hypothetical protein